MNQHEDQWISAARSSLKHVRLIIKPPAQSLFDKIRRFPFHDVDRPVGGSPVRLVHVSKSSRPSRECYLAAFSRGSRAKPI